LSTYVCTLLFQLTLNASHVKMGMDINCKMAARRYGDVAIDS